MLVRLSACMILGLWGLGAVGCTLTYDMADSVGESRDTQDTGSDAPTDTQDTGSDAPTDTLDIGSDAPTDTQDTGDIDHCTPNPCVYGTCSEGIDSYSCSCYPGWTGANCDLNIDDCAPNPCVHGACIDDVNSYSCDCEPGWSGTNCAEVAETPVVHISFREMIVWYSSLDKHRLLMGPASSVNPADGSWVVLLNANQMQNSDADESWAAVALDAGLVVQNQGWTEVRLAFHYKGADADTWWVDRVCVGSVLNTCDVFQETFDDCDLSALPSGWRVVIGAGDEASAEDSWLVADHKATTARAVRIEYNSFAKNRYLVTPAIPLP